MNNEDKIAVFGSASLNFHFSVTGKKSVLQTVLRGMGIHCSSDVQERPLVSPDFKNSFIYFSQIDHIYAIIPTQLYMSSAHILHKKV